MLTPKQAWELEQTYIAELRYFAKSYGWFGGGFGGMNIIDRITLAEDTTNAIDRCNLTLGRYGPAAFTDNIYGWFGGGYTLSASTTVVDRITLADDTTNAIDRCDLTAARIGITGFTGR